MSWGLEIGPETLRLCRAEVRRGCLRLHRRAEVAVPPGLIRPSLKDANLGDTAALSGLLRDLCRKAGCRGWVRVALPDPVFSLRTIATEALPESREEARRFLRWQARDLLPFPAEEARLDFLPAAPGPDGRVWAVCLMARDRVLLEYEKSLAGCDLQAATLDARSISLAQAASPRLGRGSVALLAVDRAWTTFLWVHDGRTRFWRILPEGEPAWAGGNRARLLREVADSIAFCQESEGVGPMEGVMVAGLGPAMAEVTSALAHWLEVPVAPLLLSEIWGNGAGPEDLAHDFVTWGPAIGAAIRSC